MCVCMYTYVGVYKCVYVCLCILCVYIYIYLFIDMCIYIYCPIGWACRIHQMLLCKGVIPTPNNCPGYDTKQSDGEVPVMPELWGMWSTPSLPLLSGSLWPRVVAPDKGPIYELNRTKPWFLEFTVCCF